MATAKQSATPKISMTVVTNGADTMAGSRFSLRNMNGSAAPVHAAMVVMRHLPDELGRLDEVRARKQSPERFELALCEQGLGFLRVHADLRGRHVQGASEPGWPMAGRKGRGRACMWGGRPGLRDRRLWNAGAG